MQHCSIFLCFKFWTMCGWTDSL